MAQFRMNGKLFRTAHQTADSIDNNIEANDLDNSYDREQRILLYSARVDNGEDIFTGERLPELDSVAEHDNDEYDSAT